MAHADTIDIISKKFKQIVEEKYNISDIKLFGSSARGDSKINSDIDILVSLPQVNRKIEEDLFDIAYDLELEYDCVIDIIVIPGEIKNSVPLYQNVLKEGIII